MAKKLYKNNDKENIIVKEKKSSAISSQYTNPNWQKKRLLIMERDDYTCKSCGDNKNTLNVHHLAYHKNSKIWEYENDELITLCKNCHEEITEYVNESISFVRGLSFSVEMADEINQIIREFDGNNPYQLMRMRKVLIALRDY